MVGGAVGLRGLQGRIQGVGLGHGVNTRPLICKAPSARSVLFWRVYINLSNHITKEFKPIFFSLRGPRLKSLAVLVQMRKTSVDNKECKVHITQEQFK